MLRSLPISLFLTLLASFPTPAQSIVAVDNGRPLGAYSNAVGLEESIILAPEGPCKVTGLRIYFSGNTPGGDTIYIAGDASEGTVPPTSWVWSYNLHTPPIYLEYDGRPGWKTFDLSHLDVRSDGYDRFVIQHRIDAAGPWFTIDNDSLAAPASSFLYNPSANGGAGAYGLAQGDFMVRLLVEYDFPEDDGSADPPAPTLVDVTREVGLVKEDGEPFGSSRVSVVDFNGDGWDDIAAQSRFFRNDGDGTFTRVDLGIAAGQSTWADYDNDGDLDCYATRGGENADVLYRNDGDGVFTDVTTESQIVNAAPAITPIWADFNGDGWLDLFITNGRTGDYPNEVFYLDKLWMNNGDGSFTDMTDASGIPEGEPAPYYDAWGATPSDYDLDGDVDVFVATYRLAPDLLYRNDGSGVFTEVARSAGVHGLPTANPSYFGHGIGAAWADYNNDLYPDLTVGNLGHPDYRGAVSNPSLLFRNEGGANPTFTEVHEDLGIKFFEMNAGVFWGDLDLDGYQDLFHSQYSYVRPFEGIEQRRLSRVYFSRGPGDDWRLDDRTWHTGAVIHGAWTAARGDFDRDGDLDIVVASPRENLTLFRNELPLKGRVVQFRLRGNPALGVNADAYGSRVVVEAGGTRMMRELAGAGNGATGTQHSNALHFGLGGADIVDRVTVHWPNGTTSTFEDVEVNREYEIRLEDQGVIQEIRETLSAPVGSAPPGEGLLRARYRDGIVSVSWAAIEGDAAAISLVDVSGRSILQRGLDAAALSANLDVELPPGTYILRLESTSREYTKVIQLGRSTP